MENIFYMFLNEKARSSLTHLKMNMNKMSSEKNIATLSIVRSITNNWRLRFGMKRTNFKIRNKRNVRKTLRPELPSPSPKNCWPSSKTLSNQTRLEISFVNWFLWISLIFSLLTSEWRWHHRKHWSHWQYIEMVLRQSPSTASQPQICPKIQCCWSRQLPWARPAGRDIQCPSTVCWLKWRVKFLVESTCARRPLWCIVSWNLWFCGTISSR